MAEKAAAALATRGLRVRAALRVLLRRLRMLEGFVCEAGVFFAPPFEVRALARG